MAVTWKVLHNILLKGRRMFKLKGLLNNKAMKYGVPMMVLIVGGSFGLKEFTQIRYDAQWHRKRLDPALEAHVDVEKQANILEDEYEKIKEANLDEWKNIRGPRPWEDSKEYQDQQRSNQNKNKE